MNNPLQIITTGSNFTTVYKVDNLDELATTLFKRFRLNKKQVAFLTTPFGTVLQTNRNRQITVRELKQ